MKPSALALSCLLAPSALAGPDFGPDVRTVRKAAHFVVGAYGLGGGAGAEERALRRLLARGYPADRFVALAREATPAGKLYCVLALHLRRDPRAARVAVPAVRITTFQGCFGTDLPAAAFRRAILAGEHDETMHRPPDRGLRPRTTG